MARPSVSGTPVHTLSVVIPVYKGARSLPAVIDEITPLVKTGVTPEGRRFRVIEVILVHDNGPDDSDVTMRDLEDRNKFVSTIWLSRNFGQHAATVAGMSESAGEWVVTLDEDGQHDPADIPAMLDVAVGERASLVYGKPVNAAPHGRLRNLASRSAKNVLAFAFANSSSQHFQSFRIVRGDIARQLAAFAVSGVYLDVALSWVTDRVRTAPITLRNEGERISGYSYASLFAHFWRMVLSSGTRGLRLVTGLGIFLALGGLGLAIYIAVARVAAEAAVPGWTSLMVITLLCSGAILLSLGIIAEYVGVTLNVAMGRPLYLKVDDPARALPMPGEEKLSANRSSKS